MRQYFEIKSKYKDTILLYRMGDFYETFDEDARNVHKVLGITLTKRANGKAAEVALAGFPYHALESYLPKLIRAGYRVAICEQLEDPKAAKGIVKRDVIEVVTPGTTLSDKILDQKSNNFLGCIAFAEDRYGLALIDGSTGEFLAGEFSEKELLESLNAFTPAEIVVPFQLYDRLTQLLKSVRWPYILTRQEDWLFTYEYAFDKLLGHFKTHSLKGFGVQEYTIGVCAAGAALHYLKETQRTDVAHVNRMATLDRTDFMMLDAVTLRNLEIMSASTERGVHGSLIAILDQTQTPMGGRMMKQWITRPLRVLDKINRRLMAVDELHANLGLRENILAILKDMTDVERLISKVCANRVNPREIRALGSSLAMIPKILACMESATSEPLTELRRQLKPLDQVTDEIDRALVDDPSVQIKDGNVIQKGYNEELDSLRDIAFNGKTYLANLQNRERERTGIGSLKIQYNQVFGYYIEITNTHKDKVPLDYIRKQTLSNAERFITPELKEYEEKILTAEEKINRLELELFDQLRKTIAGFTAEIQRNAGLIAELDCYVSLSEVAAANKYVRPVVNDGETITIEEGRHPVVEKLLPAGEPFIPNDLHMDVQSQIHIITGPNMAGKSSYLRQVGLIVLLAQMGSFVPAKSAVIGVVDKIFTRVGASDNMAAGESTFLVEMNETANILHNATSRSLILLDEIGRGTSTFDGLSIAWAIVEYLHNHPLNHPKTLFATHYHELVEMEELFPRVKNYNMLVKKYQDKIVFVRKIVPGGCDHSYGIEVAQLAGLPKDVIRRAREVMQNLESHDISAHKDRSEIGVTPMQMTIFEDTVGEKIKDLLRQTDVNSLTPIEALNALNELKKMMKDS
ncbi:DNA mismatch repair protein MutS [bacterium]|nr:DNA mismatch repair protein MutS [bacterium]